MSETKTARIWTDDEEMIVDLNDVGELESAMRFKAEHIKAKADPQLFEAVADMMCESNSKRKIHELKILPKYFEEVMNLNKKFELRKDDRGYQVGDFVLLKEFENGLYTGRESHCLKITYILRNCPEYGLEDGYCIFGW